MRLFVRKPIDLLQREATAQASSLHRALGPTHLVALGIGAVIGTGIFVLTGTAAAQYAGPAVVLSFVLAGIAAALAGLCYAELASMIPLAGSAYTYAYATLGELVAWIIGWDLVLEYLFGAATVAVGWSGYLVSLLKDFGLDVPVRFAHAPGVALVQLPGDGWVEVTPTLTKHLADTGVNMTALPHAQGTFNLVAALAIAAVTALLVFGIRESARFNNAIVAVKLFVILLFLGAGAWFLAGHGATARANWTPFIPPASGGFGHFGVSGVLRAAGVIFFAYIGFDAVSTTAQEAKNPQRDMPIGILGSLVICTVLYVLVAGVLTALVPYARLNVPEPIAVGMAATGLGRAGTVAVKIGALAGLSSVMLVMLMGQPRIFFSMAHDGLLPAVFSHVHPRWKTPWLSTLLAGGACALIAGGLPLAILGELVSIGTLLAFSIVCAGVLFLRRREPNRERPFRTPLVPLVPLAGIAVCVALMAGLPWETWVRLFAWMAVGLVIYFAYSRKHSRIRARVEEDARGLPDGARHA